MSTVERYVIVSDDESDKVIVQGPLLWDGVTPFYPGPDVHMMLESDALAAGYTYKPDY